MRKKIVCSALFLLVIWTGILLTGMQRQYHLLEDFERKCNNALVKMGFSNITLLREERFPNGSLLCERTALLQYIASREQGDAAIAVSIMHGGNAAASGSGIEIVDNPSEEIENITVFNNGSSDITSYNKIIKIMKPDKDVQDNIKKRQKTEEKKADSGNTEPPSALQENRNKIQTLQNGQDRSYLLKNFYIVDSSTSIDKKIFQVNSLLTYDVTMKQEKKPQILIYHTHGASEAFIDSRAGVKSDSIIGVGEELANILTKQYAYHVIHDETEYDKVGGNIDRNKAYNQSYDGVSRTLEKYPSIQVIIDLHRDGVGGKVHRLTTIDGKKTAQVMFFNGLSRNSRGDIAYLRNDNLQANLAFSLQMKIACMENYPDFAKPVYLKSYRYNLHLRERSLLIELGNENNTLQEAKNAMEPLAKVLHQVLSGEES